MEGIYGFQVIIVPNEDESFSPLSQDRVPKGFEYKKDKVGLTYVLEFLWKHGIRRVTIACRDEGEYSQISECTEQFKGDIAIKQVGDSNGTADRLMKLEIPTGDFFIVIVGNPDLSVNLCEVSDLYRRKECCCAMVLKKNNEHKIDNNKANSVYGITNDGVIVAYAEVVSRIKEFKLPKTLLYDYPVFNYYSNLIDCGIYFCKRPLLDTLQFVEDMSDFKGDFLSTLIRRQHTHQDTHYKELRNSIKAFFICLVC